MKIAGKFEKVSFPVFFSDYKRLLGGEAEEALDVYNSIELPKRATRGSAGYDFFCPAQTTISAGESVFVPTGIRAKIAAGWVLTCYPRSSLGFKYRLALDNTVGVIDSDYYLSDNEGHIIVKMTNNSAEGKTLALAAGERFMQGVFLEYGITEDDCCTARRNGGFGSTSKFNI